MPSQFKRGTRIVVERMTGIVSNATDTGGVRVIVKTENGSFWAVVPECMCDEDRR